MLSIGAFNNSQANEFAKQLARAKLAKERKVQRDSLKQHSSHSDKRSSRKKKEDPLKAASVHVCSRLTRKTDPLGAAGSFHSSTSKTSCSSAESLSTTRTKLRTGVKLRITSSHKRAHGFTGKSLMLAEPLDLTEATETDVTESTSNSDLSRNGSLVSSIRLSSQNSLNTTSTVRRVCTLSQPKPRREKPAEVLDFKHCEMIYTSWDKVKAIDDYEAKLVGTIRSEMITADPTTEDAMLQLDDAAVIGMIDDMVMVVGPDLDELADLGAQLQKRFPQVTQHFAIFCKAVGQALRTVLADGLTEQADHCWKLFLEYAVVAMCSSCD